jgi:hypothetical protein
MTGRSQPSINVVHRLLRARDYQDRPELGQLCSWWRESGMGAFALIGIGGAGKTAIVERFMRTVPGGTPDRTVTQDPSLPPPTHLFVFSFYVDPEPEVFVTRLHDWLQAVLGVPAAGGGEAGPVAYPLLFQLLQRMPERTLLVLDGVERIQDDGLRGGTFGQIEDSGLREFFLRVAGGSFPTIGIVATTRFPLDDLEYVRSPNYVSLVVESLPRDAGIALLRERGVRGDRAALTEIAELCGWHALTMDLAGGYVGYFGGGDPQSLLTLSELHELVPTTVNRRDHHARYVAEQNQRFSRIAARYREAFRERDPDALMVLEYICLFRRGAVEDLLKRHFGAGGGSRQQIGNVRDEPVFVEQSERSLSGSELTAKLDLLVDMRLVDANSALLSSADPGQDKSHLLLLRRLAKLYQEKQRPLGDQRRIHARRIPAIDKSAATADGERERRPRPASRPTRVYTIHPAVRDGFLLGYRAERARQGHLALIPELESFLDRRPGGEITLDQDALNILEEIIYHALESGYPRLAFAVYRREMGRFVSLGWRYGDFERGNRVLRAIAGGRTPRGEPQLADLRPEDRSIFFLDWAKFLLPLGALTDVVACTAQLRRISAEPNDPAKAHAWEMEAGAHLLAGRFVLAEAAGTAQVSLSSALQDTWSRLGVLKGGHSVAAHAESMRGNVAGAIEHFTAALAAQRTLEQAEDRPLHGLRGAWYALLLVRLGRFDEAVDEVSANLNHSRQASGVDTFLAFPHLQLVLAEAHLDRGNLASASDAVNAALNVGLRRNAKDVLCWAQLVAARIALAGARGGDAMHHDRLSECLRTTEEGLSLAREFGLSSYHVDLLLCRAEYHLMMGQPAAAERDAALALFGAQPADAGMPHWLAEPRDGSSEPHTRGLFPPPGSGWPDLYAASHPHADYRWAALRGFRVLADAALLAAAQRHGAATFVPALRNELPPQINDLIRAGAEHLARAEETCRTLERAGLDIDACPATSSTRRAAEALAGGILTTYPVSLPSDARSQPQSARPVPVFVSYSHEDRSLVDELRRHLRALERDELIEVWTDRRIEPGYEWDPAIATALSNAQIVILAVSASFVASDYIHDVELTNAMAAQRAGRCRVLPVILRDCDWSGQAFASLQTMPDGARPVDSWPQRDEAWADITRRVRRVAVDLRSRTVVS